MARPELSSLIRALQGAVPGGVRLNEPLSTLSQWRIGGPASVVVSPTNREQVAAAMTVLAGSSIPRLIMGGSTNLLFDDAGFDGVIVRIGGAMGRVTLEGGQVITAEAGAWVPSFVRTALHHGLSGCEHAIGIPGTVGGLVLMNGGSQRRGIGEQLLDVTVVDSDGNVRTLGRDECDFSYRHSALQKMDVVIVGARFKYEAGDPRALRKAALKILVDRSRKFPRKLPNCGSVFLSDPKMYDEVGPPGLAIERVGLKGARIGGAEISPTHANFIVNLGEARAADVLALIHLAKSRVLQETGFSMGCEVRFVSSDGVVQPADLV